MSPCDSQTSIATQVNITAVKVLQLQQADKSCPGEQRPGFQLHRRRLPFLGLRDLREPVFSSRKGELWTRSKQRCVVVGGGVGYPIRKESRIPPPAFTQQLCSQMSFIWGLCLDLSQKSDSTAK